MPGALLSRRLTEYRRGVALRRPYPGVSTVDGAQAEARPSNEMVGRAEPRGPQAVLNLKLRNEFAAN